MIEAEFKALLHDRLGPALDELVAPDLLDRVRVRQVKHKRSVRAGLAAASAAGVAAVVLAVALWPATESAGPTAPASSGSLRARAPSPWPAILNMTAVAPLVTSGPCGGLIVAAYEQSAGLHPPVTAVTAGGVEFTLAGDQTLGLMTAGPCVNRLSYVQRTSAFWNDPDVPHSFVSGFGAVVTHAAASNQTGAVQLFLDCKGLACGDSGAPLATITVRVTGTAPGAASLTFNPLPIPLTAPTGDVMRVPSVIGLSLDAAREEVAAAGFAGFGVEYAGGTGPAGLVLAQNPPAGSVIFRAGGVNVTVSGRRPAESSAPSAPSGLLAPPSSAIGSSNAAPVAAMPSVMGLSLSEAAAVLKGAGFTYVVTYRNHQQASGTVTFQNPKAGQTVSPHMMVQLTVSLGPVPRQQ